MTEEINPKEVLERLRAVGADVQAIGCWNDNEGIDMFVGYEVVDVKTKERLHSTRKATMKQIIDIMHRLERERGGVE